MRERISIPARQLAGALRHLYCQPGVQECTILSTCNRTEIYLSAAEWLDGRNLFCRLIRDLHGFNMTDMQDQIYALLGAGKMGELAALHLREAGASSIVVTNRTLSRAEEVAARCSGTAVEFERREEQIAKADVVICSASIAKPRRVDLVIRVELHFSAVSPCQ